MRVGATPRGRARSTRVGLAAIWCALTVVAATPAHAQVPLTPDVPEPAVEPVVRVAEPVTQAAAPATKLTEPVAKAAEPVANAAAPATNAGNPLSNVTEPVAKAAAPATKAGDPVSKVTEPVANAAAPVTKTGDPVSKVREPATQAVESVSRAVEPVTRAAGDVTRASEPVLGATEPGGRAPGGGPGDPPGGLGLGIGEQAITTTGAGTPPARVLPKALPAGPPDLPRGDAASARQAGSPTHPSQALGSLLAGLETFSGLPTPFPAAPGLTEPTAASRGPGTAAPEQSGPAPSAPAGPAAAGAAAAGTTALILALVALLLLAAPNLSRFFRTVPAFLRPAPFICALERPG
jgi:hypothetical protein